MSTITTNILFNFSTSVKTKNRKKKKGIFVPIHLIQNFDIRFTNNYLILNHLKTFATTVSLNWIGVGMCQGNVSIRQSVDFVFVATVLAAEKQSDLRRILPRSYLPSACRSSYKKDQLLSRPRRKRGCDHNSKIEPKWEVSVFVLLTFPRSILNHFFFHFEEIIRLNAFFRS